ncbi:SAM-dependent methyltransferase [Haliea sp. E1-2-M8]|uniref:tRNA (guanine(46)-N(7))-methyltransferase TrmB n=1 Tax=Haliea sp. E1-2-M8 TaxID=3064706 RepID=UPI002721ACF3|nr:SAM-dependent methyltransferase [Haliea sp. E1-2-M8]MDO8860987.1 SAM-dependent methyltransferase [Haliea sp. E1-2-M8]
MQASSRQVTSNQPGLHPRLARTVLRHLQHPHRSPLAAHNQAAWDELLSLLQADDRPLVLDSFCGTGMSTAHLASRHPQHLVIGIDRSAQRLHRHSAAPGANYLLLQAECEPLWQQLAAARRQVDHHYLLYPNPWPKSRHLQRRIHGHPGFRDLLALGGRVELRSNWKLYVEEFGVAMYLAGVRGLVRQLPEAPPLTRFEDKYRHSGQVLWQYQGRIGYSERPNKRN